MYGTELDKIEEKKMYLEYLDYYITIYDSTGGYNSILFFFVNTKTEQNSDSDLILNLNSI